MEISLSSEYDYSIGQVHLKNDSEISSRFINKDNAKMLFHMTDPYEIVTWTINLNRIVSGYLIIYIYVQVFYKYFFSNPETEFQDLKKRFFKDEIYEDACSFCLAGIRFFQQRFIQEMKDMLNFRGHGFLFLIPGEEVYDWDVYSIDEIEMMLKLIVYGAKTFHFVIDATTKLDIEYQGHHLKTDTTIERL
jgi:hypothetical protein